MKKIAMTVSQVERALKKHRFIMLRDRHTLKQIAVNSKLFETNIGRLRRGRIHGNRLTDWMSYRPCSFQEYISYKTPFI